MSVQVRRRREAAAFLQTYVGAQAELIVDTTNSRVQVHDGTTAGGWPAAKLAEVAQRRSVNDGNTAILPSDRLVAFTALTASRTVALPAAAAYPPGFALTIADESGACSATNTITVLPNGADTINGVPVAFLALAYGVITLESNGTHWTIVEPLGTLAVQNNGTTNSAAASSGSFVAHTPTLTLPANFLGNGRAIRILAAFRLTTGTTTSAISFRLRAGSAPLVLQSAVSTPGASQNAVSFGFTYVLQATAAPSAASTVEATIFGNSNPGVSTVVNSQPTPVALATNTPLTLQMDSMWAAAGSGNTLTLSQFIVEALN